MSPHRVVDTQDTPERIRRVGFMAVAVLAPTLAFAAWLFHQGEFSWGCIVAALGLLFGGVPGAIWVMQRREASLAGPGELEAEPWPPVALQPITVRYRRRIRAGGRPQLLTARLDRQVSTSDGVRVAETRRLEQQDWTSQGKVLEAGWTFEAPASAPPSAGAQDGWWLIIEITLASGPVLDSRFKLEMRD